jgi:cytochrome b561
MQWMNSPARYGAASQALHWLTALCVVAGWLLGEFMDEFPRGTARTSALWAHITLGQLVIVLLLARLMWRLFNPLPPPEPTRFGRPLEIASRLGHYALYLLLFLVPVAGVMVQLKRGNPLPIFGLTTVASPLPADRATARSILEVHELLANTLLILAGGHAIAALVHHYALRDRTLTRMLPG